MPQSNLNKPRIYTIDFGFVITNFSSLLHFCEVIFPFFLRLLRLGLTCCRTRNDISFWYLEIPIKIKNPFFIYSSLFLCVLCVFFLFFVKAFSLRIHCYNERTEFFNLKYPDSFGYSEFFKKIDFFNFFY
jgi:hypothetical protein